MGGAGACRKIDWPLFKMRIAEIEMETTATREYAGYCQEEGHHPIRLPQSMPHPMAGLGAQAD